MFFGLAVVLALLMGAVWLLKRFSSPLRGNGPLRILGITPVGTREKIVLVEAGEKILLLGVTPNSINALHVFSRDELPLPPAATSGQNPVLANAASFASRLAQIMKGRRDAG
jgi:flagellar protein FliO/FliZ